MYALQWHDLAPEVHLQFQKKNWEIYAKRNNILLETQSRFGNGQSTDKTLYEITDKIICGLSAKMHAGEIFSEIVKAFNLVSHGILPWKLKFFMEFKSDPNGRK